MKLYFLFIFHFQTSDSIIASSLAISGEIGGFQREESQDVIRDIDWSTRNVMLGYDVAGISPILLLTKSPNIIAFCFQPISPKKVPNYCYFLN